MSTHVIGIALFVVGIVLLGFGMGTAHPVAGAIAVDAVSKTAASPHSDGTMWLLVGGGILTLGGIALVLIGGRRALKS